MNMLDVEKPEDFAASSFLESVIGGARTKISLVRVAILLLSLTIYALMQKPKSVLRLLCRNRSKLIEYTLGESQSLSWPMGLQRFFWGSQLLGAYYQVPNKRLPAY